MSRGRIETRSSGNPCSCLRNSSRATVIAAYGAADEAGLGDGCEAGASALQGRGPDGAAIETQTALETRRVEPAAGPAQSGVAMDFVSDALTTGHTLRTFTLIDSYTKESLAIEVNTGISSRQVTRVLERVIEERGVPGAIRCDNGPEFTSLYFIEWCKEPLHHRSSYSTGQTCAQRSR